MIKNVIFDLGRVIYNYWPRADILELGFSEAQADLIMERVFDNPLWNELDRGTYTLREGAEKFCVENPELEGMIRRVLDEGWVDRVITIMPDSLEFFYDLKRRGFRVYILTNFPEDEFAHVRKRDAFFNDAEGIVVSAHEKLIKPDPAIYQCILSRYNLVPKETVFIDDKEENIVAAKVEGISGIVFTDLVDCKQQFEQLCKVVY